jgi:pimeloyl-ACP methyl ester carboxylesterase
MEPLATTVIDTDLGPLAVHQGGGAGPWVICWPTLMGDSASMHRFALRLLHRHRVVLIDPPGFGSNRSIGQWPALAGHAALAHRVADALGMDRFHWVGHGFGGHVGAALAARVGYRMASITLSSTPFVQEARVHMLSRMVRGLLYPTDWGRRVVSRHMARQMVKGNTAERTLCYQSMAAALMGCNTAVLPMLEPTPQKMLIQLRERLDPIAIPRLVLAGRMDTLVLPRDQRTLADVLKARYEQVDSGFMTFLVQPNECANLVRAFWEDHPRPAAD